MGKNIVKKHKQKLEWQIQPKPLDHAKQSAKNGLKTTSKKVIQKAAEATGDLIDRIEFKNSEKL